jgi:hypothetical protein
VADSDLESALFYCLKLDEYEFIRFFSWIQDFYLCISVRSTGKIPITNFGLKVQVSRHISSGFLLHAIQVLLCFPRLTRRLRHVAVKPANVFHAASARAQEKIPEKIRFSVCSPKILGWRTPAQKKMTSEKSRLACGLRRFQAVKSARFKRLF